MKLDKTLMLKFEKPDWSSNPEFGLIDSISEQRSDMLRILDGDIVNGEKQSRFGRKDAPSVEPVVQH